MPNYLATLVPLVGYLGLATLLNLRFQNWGMRRTLLRATVLWAALSVLQLEALSLLEKIGRPGLILSWLAVIVGLSVGAIRMRERWASWKPPEIPHLEQWSARLLLLALAVIVAITFIVALFAAPNTWDSLTYHMSRVAHWAQNGSLSHYATGIERQNFMSPGAEMLVLQNYALWGGDRLANLVQWTAMVFSLLAVSLIVKDLGGSITSQLFSSVFVATLPMGIAQATSTMTDYVTGYWLLLVAMETIDLMRDHSVDLGVNITFLGLAAGLAVLTKPISFAYLVPFAVIISVGLLRQHGVVQFLKASALVVFLVGLVNAGYFTRNALHYGNPIGTNEGVGRHSNEILNWRVLVSNVLRNASLHAGTDFESVNDFTYLMLAKVHWKLELALNDPRTSVHDEFRIFEPSTDENWAGNPFHALLILITFPVSVALFTRNRELALYSVAVAAGFVVLSVMFKFTIFGSRYHTPFFVMAAPLAAVVLGKLPWRIATLVVAALLLVASRPWLLQLDGRNLNRNLLTAPRHELYLGGELEATYMQMVSRINERDCNQVGIMVSGNYPEYPIWVYLNAPRHDLKVEWIISENDVSGQYADPVFEPCAVICQYCPADWTQLGGLPLNYEMGAFKLFLQDE